MARFEKDEAETSRELNEVTRQLNALYQKQGRESQFGSVEERDEWIRKQVASLQDAVRQKEAGLGKTREQHEQTR